MITGDGVVKFALVEYRRSPSFRAYVDGLIERLIRAGEVRPGSSLEAILGTQSAGGEPLAKGLLERFHNQSTLPQWQRARHGL